MSNGPPGTPSLVYLPGKAARQHKCCRWRLELLAPGEPILPAEPGTVTTTSRLNLHWRSWRDDTLQKSIRSFVHQDERHSFFQPKLLEASTVVYNPGTADVLY